MLGGDSRLGQVVLVENLAEGFRAKIGEHRGVHWPEFNEQELSIGKLLAEVPHCERGGCVGRNPVQVL